MSLFKSYFESHSIYLLALGILFFAFSAFFQARKQEQWVLPTLILCALCIFSFAGTLDPFLNLWDERFHALVAKNNLNHFFIPTLYDDPVLPFDDNRWDRSHIWLHKQPLFLWQSTVAFKIFGVSEYTLRIPSIILATLLAAVLYRCGKVLANNRTGFIAAGFFISSNYLLELISGRQLLEHNDISFIAYVSFSIWAFIEHHKSRSLKWVILIGLFSGCAILCKWLVGLLIYAGWVLFAMFNEKDKANFFKDFATALLMTILVAAPWQIYTFINFPEEAMLEMKYNSKHFWEVVEGHGGGYLYHFKRFPELYGWLITALIIPSMLLFKRGINYKKLFFPLLSMIAIVYIFFSFAATKMPSFTLAVLLPIYLMLATFINYLFDLLDSRLNNVRLAAAIQFMFLITVFIGQLNIEGLQANHTSWKPESAKHISMMTHNKEVFESLKLSKNAVLFNVKGRHYVEAMFYLDVPAYNYLPTVEQVERLEKLNRTIVVLHDDTKNLPDYLTSRPGIIYAPHVIQGYD